MMKYNFSGHPVVGFEFAPFVGAQFSNDGEELHQNIRNILLFIPNRKELLLGHIPEIILPGLSQAAAILLAEWHNQFGNFPRIRWAVNNSKLKRFEYPETAQADLNEIRNTARHGRYQ